MSQKAEMTIQLKFHQRLSLSVSFSQWQAQKIPLEKWAQQRFSSESMLTLTSLHWVFDSFWQTPKILKTHEFSSAVTWSSGFVTDGEVQFIILIQIPIFQKSAVSNIVFPTLKYVKKNVSKSSAFMQNYACRSYLISILWDKWETSLHTAILREH